MTLIHELKKKIKLHDAQIQNISILDVNRKIRLLTILFYFYSFYFYNQIYELLTTSKSNVLPFNKSKIAHL